jgi:hypothetical protein
VRARKLSQVALIPVVVALLVAGSVPARAARGAAVPTPDVACRAGDHPERMQGRAPSRDYQTGRAVLGYTCNAKQVAHVGASGGYRTYRYVDAQHHACAFWDSTLLFPLNTVTSPSDTGVWVMDMTDPRHPVHTTTLRTPAMQTPHESFSLNVKRGLIGAVSANPIWYPGQFDLYSVHDDCRAPVLQASLPVGVLGHEGSFSPDGMTYYSSGLSSKTVAAIDVSNPQMPITIWVGRDWRIHGLNISADGRTLYGADTGNDGLVVLDVSEVQARVMNPTVRQIGHLTWAEVSTPQTDIPITVKGRPYLVEIDEFGAGGNAGPVGAARIIDIANPKRPRVVSNMRLAVNNKPTDPGLLGDPGANSSLQGYAGHYCAVPSVADPSIVACSFIVSGLRVFDISNLKHPREIAYFNKPQTNSLYPGGSPRGAYAMSQPAFDVARGDIWYTDGNSGFYVVHVASSYWPR